MKVTTRTAISDVLAPAVMALVAAVLVACAIGRINAAYPVTPDRAVTFIALLCAAIILVPVLGVWLARRNDAAPTDLAGIVVLSLAVVLAGVTLSYLWSTITYPADFLVWSESDFVNDLIKLRVGHPLYTAQANNESFVYMPGAQLLSYGLALVTGHGTSVPVLRGVQLGYTLLAAGIGTLAVRRILRLGVPDLVLAHPRAHAAIWFCSLFLVATNGITNAYIVNLHNDALAQLISVVAFWLLLEYAAQRDRRVLFAMALIPALGYLVKQSLALWAVLYCGYLLMFDRPRSFARLLVFGGVAFGLLAAIVGGGYLVWGPAFLYWTITVLGAHKVEPLRSVQHVLDAWTYFAVGIGAGLVLLRGNGWRILVGPWLVWLAAFGLAAYTSGIAWMLNHLGPGSTIAGIWMLAAATLLWARLRDTPRDTATERLLQPAIAVAVAGLLCSGLGVIRIPLPSLTPDAWRYAREIEAQFAGTAPQDVLLDAGSWVYVKSGVVMKDRAPSIGERGYSMTGDFSAFIDRIRHRQYAKILVRNYQSPDFWYDHESWRKSSGIREALQANYHQVGLIAGVTDRDGVIHNYLFNPISILARNEP